MPLVGGWIIATSGWQAAMLVHRAAGDRRRGRDPGHRARGRPRPGRRPSPRARPGRVVKSLRHERDLLWLFAASSVAAAGRGLGVVTTFVPLYLSLVLGLDAATIAVMYTLLLVGSVPGPLVAGRFADRLGHRPVLLVTYVFGAASLALFVLVGSNIPLVWLAIGFMSAFVYEESSLLQALLADVAPPAIRDVAFASYFTLMFVIGAIWAAVLGLIVGALGNEVGFPVIFSIMALSYLAAGVVVLGIRAGGRGVIASGRRPRPDGAAPSSRATIAPFGRSAPARGRAIHRCGAYYDIPTRPRTVGEADTAARMSRTERGRHVREPPRVRSARPCSSPRASCRCQRYLARSGGPRAAPSRPSEVQRGAAGPDRSSAVSPDAPRRSLGRGVAQLGSAHRSGR